MSCYVKVSDIQENVRKMREYADKHAPEWSAEYADGRDDALLELLDHLTGFCGPDWRIPTVAGRGVGDGQDTRPVYPTAPDPDLRIMSAGTEVVDG